VLGDAYCTKAPQKVRCGDSWGMLTVQKGFGVETTRGRLVVYTYHCIIRLLSGQTDIDFRKFNLPDEWDTSEGSINLITWNATVNAAACTTEETVCQEAISSTFLLAVQKHSVDYIVCTFVVDPSHD